MVWTNILMEAVCFYDTFSKKTQKLVSADDLDDNFKLKKGAKWRVEKNKCYVNPKLRPMWCIRYNKKRLACFYCLDFLHKRRCPFLLMSNCVEREYKAMHRALNKLNIRRFTKNDRKESDFHKKLIDQSDGLIQRAYKKGLSINEIAKKFDIDRNTVYWVLKNGNLI